MKSNINYTLTSIGAAGALAMLLGAAGCTAPLSEMDLRLARQNIDLSFGEATGTLPKLPCNDVFDVCKALPSPLPGVAIGCDRTRMECVGSYPVRLWQIIDLSRDIAFQTGIGQMTAENIRQIKLSYGIDNTVTFDIPTTKVYVSPDKTILSPAGAGVEYIGEIGPFKAGESVPDDGQELVIPEGTPAFNLLVDRIAHPETAFAFLLSTTAVFYGGAPYPAGKLQLRLTPVLTLLKR